VIDNLVALGARDDWLWIVSKWPALRAALRPGGGNALSGMPPGGGESGVPIDLDVSDLMREIEDSSRFYAKVLWDEAPRAHGCNDACYLETPPIPVEECPDRAGCEGELYLGAGKTAGKCRVCETPFTHVEQMVFIEAELQARLMTQSEIISALVVLGSPVPEGTVKSWIARKRLLPVDEHDEKRLYRLVEAKALAETRSTQGVRA
jgi:hypothetical protein